MSTELFDLTGKVAIVTGAGVVIADIDYTEAEATARKISNALALVVDVTVREACLLLVNQTITHYGKLDIMIFNAGIDIIKPAEELTENEWDAIINVDLKGYFNCAQAAPK